MDHLPSKPLLCISSPSKVLADESCLCSDGLCEGCVAVVREIDRLQQDLARYRSSHDVLMLMIDTQKDKIKELEACNSSLMNDLLQGSIKLKEMEQSQRQGWNYAKEVEDEYRKRTGRGFGDPEPPAESHAMFVLRHVLNELENHADEFTRAEVAAHLREEIDRLSLTKAEPPNARLAVYPVTFEVMDEIYETLKFYANLCSYQGERIGGVLAGCPRGPEPTPDQLVIHAQTTLQRIDAEVLGRAAVTKEPTLTCFIGQAPLPLCSLYPQCACGLRRRSVETLGGQS